MFSRKISIKCPAKGLKKVDLNFEEVLIIELKYRVKVGTRLVNMWS